VRDCFYVFTVVLKRALFAQDLSVDLAGSHVVGPFDGETGKALVVTEVLVSFDAVVGYEHLTVLLRADSAGVLV
jgi:hypothetical protein